MRWSRALPTIALIALLAVAALARTGGDEGSAELRPGATVTARVTRVVDGDTVVARLAAGGTERVRYIGVDTPETVKPDTPVQCFGHAASAENERLVAGERVTLRFDAELRDRYGRLLAYVTRRRDGLDVNASLLRGGYARPLAIAPNVARAARFAALARTARTHDRGLWRTCRAG